MLRRSIRGFSHSKQFRFHQSQTRFESTEIEQLHEYFDYENNCLRTLTATRKLALMKGYINRLNEIGIPIQAGIFPLLFKTCKYSGGIVQARNLFELSKKFGYKAEILDYEVLLLQLIQIKNNEEKQNPTLEYTLSETMKEMQNFEISSWVINDAKIRYLIDQNKIYEAIIEYIKINNEDYELDLTIANSIFLDLSSRENAMDYIEEFNLINEYLQKKGIEKTEIMNTSTLKFLFKIKDYDNYLQLYSELSETYQPDIEIYNQLLTIYKENDEKTNFSNILNKITPDRYSDITFLTISEFYAKENNFQGFLNNITDFCSNKKQFSFDILKNMFLQLNIMDYSFENIESLIDIIIEQNLMKKEKNVKLNYFDESLELLVEKLTIDDIERLFFYRDSDESILIRTTKLKLFIFRYLFGKNISITDKMANFLTETDLRFTNKLCYDMIELIPKTAKIESMVEVFFIIDTKDTETKLFNKLSVIFDEIALHCIKNSNYSFIDSLLTLNLLKNSFTQSFFDKLSEIYSKNVSDVEILLNFLSNLNDMKLIGVHKSNFFIYCINLSIETTLEFFYSLNNSILNPMEAILMLNFIENQFNSYPSLISENHYDQFKQILTKSIENNEYLFHFYLPSDNNKDSTFHLLSKNDFLDVISYFINNPTFDNNFNDFQAFFLYYLNHYNCFDDFFDRFYNLHQINSLWYNEICHSLLRDSFDNNPIDAFMLLNKIPNKQIFKNCEIIIELLHWALFPPENFDSINLSDLIQCILISDKITISPRLYYSMISSCFSTNEYESVIGLFYSMNKNNIIPTEDILKMVAHSFIKLQQFDNAKQIIDKIEVEEIRNDLNNELQ